jgi:hypothetical protein
VLSDFDIDFHVKLTCYTFFCTHTHTHTHTHKHTMRSKLSFLVGPSCLLYRRADLSIMKTYLNCYLQKGAKLSFKRGPTCLFLGADSSKFGAELSWGRVALGPIRHVFK